eukprot:5255861-Pyramimonas_sp.AAC.1
MNVESGTFGSAAVNPRCDVDVIVYQGAAASARRCQKPAGASGHTHRCSVFFPMQFTMGNCEAKLTS